MGSRAGVTTAAQCCKNSKTHDLAIHFGVEYPYNMTFTRRNFPNADFARQRSGSVFLSNLQC